VDYRNVCCFVIFTLAFFCYEFHKKNGELKTIINDQEEVLEQQNNSIIQLQHALRVAAWNGYYEQPKPNPVH
jgi:hypothetical protein